MKLPREGVVWSLAIVLLIVFVALAGSGIFESKWTMGSLSDSMTTSVHGLTVKIMREYIEGDKFHVVVELENGASNSAILGKWTNLRLEDRQGHIYTGSGPPDAPEKLNPNEKYDADLTFDVQTVATFPVMLEFPEAALCGSDVHPGDLNFVLEGQDIQRTRRWEKASRAPASAPATTSKGYRVDDIFRH